MASKPETRPLRQQIEEVEREIRLRGSAYPRWISQKKIRRGEAEEHMARMRAVLATLKDLQRQEGDGEERQRHGQ